MASYALFFTVLLVVMATAFRGWLESTLTSQSRDLLDQEWAAMKGYLRIENRPGPRGGPETFTPIWFFDPNDPDEAFIVEQLRRVYLLADKDGKVMQWSEVYRSIGFNSPEEIQAVIKAGKPQWWLRRNAAGAPFMIRAGVVYDERHSTAPDKSAEPFFVAIGRSVAPAEHILHQYTWVYTAIIPLTILTGCLLGWFLAGRGLEPVTEVARAAQRISGSNLSLRIPVRGAGDELDFLIETFNRMIQRLDNSFRQIRQFSTDVSHELRTPITAIRGQLEVALFTASTTEQYREAILNALQDCERLSQIVRALLLLSQAESGQLALRRNRIDLSEVLRDVVDQFQIPADGAHVQLSADLSPGCLAEVDRVQIERMISNLLSNALKFTPAGGRVHVSLGWREDQVEIVVEDTGCGIAADHLPHIFDRFYRVPHSGEETSPERGLGLGLSFVAWIVKAHGGHVEVASQPGEGTRFRILLPATAPQAAREESPQPVET
ncbi:MAG TPA: ATP-binding protein [Bryobacteraceae bacterium]|nr:ATP-binding protein [Bryobacteraceae bacterium]